MSGHHRAVVPRPRDLRPATDIPTVGAEHAGRDGASDRRRPGLRAQRGGTPAGRRDQPDRPGVLREEHRGGGWGMGRQSRCSVIRRDGLHGRVRNRTPIPRYADPRHRRRNHRDHDRTGRQDAWVTNHDLSASCPSIRSASSAVAMTVCSPPWIRKPTSTPQRPRPPRLASPRSTPSWPRRSKAAARNTFSVITNVAS